VETTERVEGLVNGLEELLERYGLSLRNGTGAAAVSQ